MESLGRYLISVAAAAIICSLLEKLNGKSSGASAIIKMMCGIFMAITVVSPWLKLQIYDFSVYADSFSQQAYIARDLGIEEAEEYKRSLITEKVSTYILDKAAREDISLTVDVIVGEDLLPERVELQGQWEEHTRQYLTELIERELGIAKGNQWWTG